MACVHTKGHCLRSAHELSLTLGVPAAHLRPHQENQERVKFSLDPQNDHDMVGPVLRPHTLMQHWTQSHLQPLAQQRWQVDQLTDPVHLSESWTTLSIAARSGSKLPSRMHLNIDNTLSTG